MNSNVVPLAYFYSWRAVPDQMISTVMQEFKDNGVDDLVFDNGWLTRILREPLFFAHLRKHAYDLKMNIIEPHAPWGQCFDLCCIDPARRENLWKEQKLAMNYAAELGAKTYTVHIGAYESVFFKTPNSELRKYALESLEKLIPEAEKLGLVIAVENSYERSNTAGEAVYYASYFNTPAVGCCFDCGHANMMEPAGKVREKYFSEMDEAWGEEIEYFPDSLGKMLPYIVTCHLHDNDGYRDAHALPGTGTIDWKQLFSRLQQAPRLLSMQTEVRTVPGLSVRKLVETFSKLRAGEDIK